jgi:undecaprenyl pyrophosphate phosphatase UppP
MLRGNSPQAQDPSKDDTAERRSFTPLILFAASPGTITGVITLAVAHAKLALPVTALVAVVVAAVVMWIPRRISRKRRLSARHGDAVYGIDRPCYGRAVRADRLPRVFHRASLTKAADLPVLITDQ